MKDDYTTADMKHSPKLPKKQVFAEKQSSEITKDTVPPLKDDIAVHKRLKQKVRMF